VLSNFLPFLVIPECTGMDEKRISKKVREILKLSAFILGTFQFPHPHSFDL
jgi:hypothetical protein